MQFPEIITITDYREFQSGGNAPARDEDIESAINTTFIQLNGICNNQIYLRWNITIDSDPLFLNTTKKDLIKQAFLLQTKYNLDYDNDTSEGTVQNTWGSNNTSITRPKRDKITQDVLNLLANAGVYQQFATQMIRTPSNSTICSPRYYAPQDNYATQEWVEQGFIPKKASFEVTDTRLFTYDATGMFTTIPLSQIEVDLSNYYTKSECDNKFATILSLASYYTKIEADNKFATISSLSDYYTKTQTDTLLENKEDKIEYIELSGASGTLTDEQFNILNSSKLNYILHGLTKTKYNFLGYTYRDASIWKLEYGFNVDDKAFHIEVVVDTKEWELTSYDLTTKTYVDTQDSALQTNINTINGKIPAQATTTNQLADKAFVNSSVQTATANFRGAWNTWTAVPTDPNLYPADYSGTKTPSTNDYMVVLDASDYTGDVLDGTWRFKYTGLWSTDGKNGWTPEYQVNREPLTAAQIAALNSGITSGRVDAYDEHIALTDNPHSVTKAQVGLGNVDNTSDLNKPISTATQNALNQKAPIGTILHITAHQTVNTYEVPTLTPANVTTLYNSIIAGRLTIVDYDPDNLGVVTYYVVDIVKNVSGVAISFRFGDTMLLTYTINNNTVDVTYQQLSHSFQTTAPTSAINDGGIHIVYLTAEPATKYNGYIYLIKEEE